MVTHDQEEALSMADTIVLMRDGKVVQVAAPQDLYTRPADLAAGRFLGVDNIVTGRPEDPVQATTLGFRSMEARITDVPPADALTRRGTVRDCAYTGGGYHLQLDTGAEVIAAVSGAAIAPGSEVCVAVPAASVMAFGPDQMLLPN